MPYNSAREKAKWLRYGFDERLFDRHPQFAHFLLRSTLGSQMKITRDPPREIGGAPALLVEGKWISFDAFLRRFETAQCGTEIREKGTQRIFTYLDTGEGLVPHDPRGDGLAAPIARLSPADYRTTLELAARFPRKPSRGSRDHVLQIVTSYVRGAKGAPWLNNLRELVMRPKHAYLRTIDPSGNVRAVGFNWNARPVRPFKTILGHFRSPDLWEYQQADERVVTNIAVTREEFEKVQAYVATYKDAPAFHLLRQNCGAFVKMAVLHATGVDIPATHSFGSLLSQSLPDTWQSVASLKTHIARRLPAAVRRLAEKIGALWRKTLALRLSLMALLLGANQSEKGYAFDAAGSKRPLRAILSCWKNYFDLSRYTTYTIAALQQWQRRQPSTKIYSRPVKLAVS
jgi:hypothetical protein